MNFLLNLQFVNLFSSYMKNNRVKSKTEKYVLKFEFEVYVRFVREQ